MISRDELTFALLLKNPMTAWASDGCEFGGRGVSGVPPNLLSAKMEEFAGPASSGTAQVPTCKSLAFKSQSRVKTYVHHSSILVTDGPEHPVNRVHSGNVTSFARKP